MTSAAAGCLLFLGLSCALCAAEYQVLCKKSTYVPNRIVVKKGEHVKVVLTSADVTHGFAIDELNVAAEVAPGPPKRVEFTPTKAGNFDFYCVVRCGKD